MSRNLDPFTAYQVKRTEQKRKAELNRLHDILFRLKGTKGMIRRSMLQAPPGYLLKMLSEWHREYNKSIDNVRYKIGEIQ